MTRVLLIGGAGYLGSALAVALLEKGACVTIYDRMVFGCRLPEQRGLRIIKGDVRDRVLLNSCLLQQDAVIHMAFLSNDAKYEVDPAMAMAVNVESMHGILDSVQAVGTKRFVFLSSCSVYGDVAGPTDEEEAVRPLTDYARHKALCERMIAERGMRVPSVVLRLATVCGPSARQRLDLLLNRMLAEACEGMPLQVQSITSIRPVLGITDFIAATLLVLGAPPSSVQGRIFNVVSESALVSGWVARIEAVCGKRLELVERSGGDARSYAPSTRRIEEIGFRPAGVEQDISGLWQRIRGGDFPGLLRNPDYINLLAQKAHDFGMGS